jgi:hypothetical protein
VLSSLPVELPTRLAWLKSGRFLRSLSALVGLAVLAAVLYNAIAVDRLPPTYSVKVTSATSAGLVMTLASVEVDFSEDVRHDTAEKAFSITPTIAGSFHWQGRKLIFTPSSKLPLATKFVAKEGAGVEDAVGNRQDGVADITFTTVGPPTIVSVTPTTNQGDVPIGTPIQVTFDRQMDTEQVAKGLSINPPLGFTVSWNGPVMTIQPKQTLAFATTYTLEIGDPAVDTDGTKLPAWATAFRTVGMGLAVTSLIPAPNVAGVNPRSTIALVYDAAIDGSSIAGTIKLTPPVSGSIKAVSLPDDRTAPAQAAAATATGSAAGPHVLQFTPDGPLAPHTTYTVSVAGIKRTDGQAATDQSWSFTTGESSASALNQIAFLSDRGGVSNVWLMNPDGSNQREVTTELVPVSGYDISGDGASITYSAGGVVRKMGIGGDGAQTLTPSGDLEYAPTFTADGLGIVVGRRDAAGNDLGYWRYPLATGTDLKQLTTDGSPGIGSVSLTGDGLTGRVGPSSWAPRAGFSSEGSKMLLVRGSDNGLELVDTTLATPAIILPMVGNSRPIYDATDGVFYVVASDDKGATWSYWQVSKDGVAQKISPAGGDLTATGTSTTSVAMIVATIDGNYHLVYAIRPTAAAVQLTGDPSFDESSPSFSPDGSMLVFGRVQPNEKTTSAGIWVISTDGKNLIELATDGAYPRWIP